MIIKMIRYFGKPMAVGCDGKCHKAWGIGQRRRKQLSRKDRDLYEYFSDKELGKAPDYPGTFEDGDGKPEEKSERLNRWCVRQCERCISADLWEQVESHNFNKRVNGSPMSWKTNDRV